ncbi:unnamed protein product [Prunus armeniaca]|uniref:Uncharacterized protein n=1 Tax=Prunus armeniaca TaxID=36596 RepID=A0A6J5UU56_PRUAR|nr:unnamed protein product [Prunus armeniaca]
MALLMSLVFSNTLRYYPIGSIERATAKNLSVVFETKWKEDMEKKPNAICHPLRKELAWDSHPIDSTEDDDFATLFIMPWIRSGLP